MPHADPEANRRYKREWARRNRGSTPVLGAAPRTCPTCGASFKPKTGQHTFCAPGCRDRDPDQRRQRRERLRAYRAEGRYDERSPAKRYRASEKYRARKREIKAAFDEFKLRIGCQRCGYSKSARALQFHHRDPSAKERKVGAALWWGGGDLYQAEVAKCDLLCANCHCEVHELLDSLPGETETITIEEIPTTTPREVPAEPAPEPVPEKAPEKEPVPG